MTTKNSTTCILASFFLIFILGCTPMSQEETRLETPTALMTETPLDTPTSPPPTSTPVPSPTPAYSYLPIISGSNAKDITRFDGYDGDVNSLAFSPNGKYLAATYANGSGIIWDISTVKYWGEWQDAPKDVFHAEGDLSFDSSSRVLATGGTLIDLSTMEIIQELPGSVVFSPAGDTLAVHNLNDVSLWNYDGNRWTLSYKKDTPELATVAFSPDGSLLGEALDWGDGEGVEIRRVSDHTLLYSFPPPEHDHPAHFNNEAYAFLTFSPDNQFIATGTKDQPVIRIWNLKTGELINDINTAISVNVMDATSGEIHSEYEIPQVACAAISQDSKVIILTGYASSIIFKSLPEGDFISASPIDPYYSPYSSYENIFSMACTTSKDGRLIATGDNHGNVIISGVPTTVP
jgi:WD40 repeat protein